MFLLSDFLHTFVAVKSIFMNKVRYFLSLCLLCLFVGANSVQAKKWSLADCINYALQNNISLQKTRITRLSAHEDVMQSKAALLPSIDASTGHNIIWRPFPESGQGTVSNGYVQSSVDKIYYSGNYGVNLNWTVWNGNRNRNQIRLNELAEQQAEVDSAVTANSIQEQIAQLYVQVLYSAEAIKVNEQSLEASRKNEEKGRAMVDVGNMSNADLAQLKAQRAQDEYNIVASESNLRNYKRQLKQLLEITDDEEFDVVVPESADEDALAEIPSLIGVYNTALMTRPEIASQKLAIQSADVNIAIAKAQKNPTVGINSSLTTNTTSMNDTGWGGQLKTNLNIGAGFTVSIPLLDNRQAKTAVNKARLAKENSELELRNQQTVLYSTIENYWIQAVTNQSKFRAAKINTVSQEASYEMLSEQFRLGLKNIVELMNGKTNLLTAKQAELESKYLTILNVQMLRFYENGNLR